MNEQIEVGDHVWVGNGKVHWVVECLSPDLQYAVLRSPMSSRTRLEWIENLRLHSKAGAFA